LGMMAVTGVGLLMLAWHLCLFGRPAVGVVSNAPLDLLPVPLRRQRWFLVVHPSGACHVAEDRREDTPAT